MTPEERADLEALADRWDASPLVVIGRGVVVDELRAVLAAHPDTSAAAPAGLEPAPACVGPEGLSEPFRTAMTRAEWREHRDRLKPFLDEQPIGTLVCAGGRSYWEKVDDQFWQSGRNTVSAITLLTLPDATSFEVAEWHGER